MIDAVGVYYKALAADKINFLNQNNGKRLNHRQLGDFLLCSNYRGCCCEFNVFQKFKFTQKIYSKFQKHKISKGLKLSIKAY